MVMVLVLAVALLIAIARGGSPARLISLPLRWPALPIAVFAVQSTVIYPPGPWLLGQRNPAGLILPVSCLVLMAMVWVNRRIPGMVLVGLGLVLNLAVILANGGYMPIAPEVLQSIGHGDHVATMEPGARVASSKDVVLPREQTRLWVLSDIFPLRPPFPIPSAFSLGDALIAAGVFVAVQLALVGPAVLKERPVPV